jgi:hypothetical protein
MVTDQQVRLLRQKRMEKKTQVAAAAAAGMSERTARTWQEGPVPSETKEARSWRTRPDPFVEVWQSEVLPLLEADERGVLEGRTLLMELQKRHPGRFPDGQVRTLQRRVRDWRALHGPPQEVMFPQEHVPGREAAIDFTHCTELGVTIAGVLLVHLLFELVLSYSGWTYVQLAFGETFEALVAGIQGGLWTLEGVPWVIRSDNLSAATHELKRSVGRALNARYKDFLDYYHLTSTRIRPGESHENGVVEQRHRRTKSALDQALVIRGSRDFPSVDAYRAFFEDVVDTRFNQPAAGKLAEERPHLQALPSEPVPTYTNYDCRVRSWSTIQVNGRTYSVPSRLKKHWVEARVHPDVVEIRYLGQLVETLPRIRKENSARVDYRHVIWSLVTKPGAFARYRFREELFPTTIFRQAYDALRGSHGDRADVEYLRVLHLAASTTEVSVEVALKQLLELGRPFDYAAVKALAAPERLVVPEVRIPAPDLAAYDELLSRGTP